MSDSGASDNRTGAPNSGRIASFSNTANDRNSTGGRNSIQKLKLPTPPRHGDTLHHPPLSGVDALWHSNLDRNKQSAPTRIGERTLADLRSAARSELVSLALTHSRQYGDFCLAGNAEDAELAACPIVMTGHQPELFHPGVWYKNFLLSRLGNRFDCPAINLIIDNDICSDPAIGVPCPSASSTEKPRTVRVPFDAPGPGIPFEERGIEDFDVLGAFGKRVAELLQPFATPAIIDELWSEVVSASPRGASASPGALGYSIAAGRHRLEQKLGLRSLDVPLSQIVSTPSFADFVWHIVSDFDRFRTIYNDSLVAYQNAHRLRSRSHPVPELEQYDGWTEIPFWVWHSNDPQRKRAFVRPDGDSFVMGQPDGIDGIQLRISHATAVDDWMEASRRGIKIRPRALMTTLYSRLVLSDLFIHGIGGGKYDQLTDLIATRFFGVPLPGFCVASATLKMPFDTTEESRVDLVETKRALRELKYHPERFIRGASSPRTQELIAGKRSWIQQFRIPGELAETHQGIVESNADLQPYVESQRRQLEERMAKLRKQIHVNQVLGSREFSFAIFPSDLPKTLSAMIDFDDD